MWVEGVAVFGEGTATLERRCWLRDQCAHRSFTDVRDARRRPKRLAQKIRWIREALGLSQREMAERLGERAGVENIPWKYISKYEREKSISPLEIALAYARVANVTFEQIVDDEMEVDL